MSMACPKSADGHAAGIVLFRGKTKIGAAVRSHRRRQAIKLVEGLERDPSPPYSIFYSASIVAELAQTILEALICLTVTWHNM